MSRFTIQPPVSRQCSIALLLSRLEDSSLPRGRIRCTTSLNLLTTRTRPNPKSAPQTHLAPSVDRHGSRSSAIRGGPHGISCTHGHPFQEGIPLGIRSRSASSSSASLPLPLSARSCRCGRPLNVLGHHRATCETAGVLGRRGWVLENVAARVSREAGGRVRVNVFVRDMDLHSDGRGWKWWLTACRSGMAHNWPSTPQWSRL